MALIMLMATFRLGRAHGAGYPAGFSTLPRLPPARTPPLDVSRRPQLALLRAGELLRVLRPVLYCAAVRRLGRRAWTPWLLSLALDAASLAVLQQVPCNAEEQEELRRRRAAMALHLLFTPAWEAGLRRPLEALRASAGAPPSPFVGLLADKVLELLDSCASMHAYTSSF